MPPLHELSALELAAAYRAGDTTPSQVVDTLLDRVRSHGDALGAFVVVTAEQARAAAAEAGARQARGFDGLPLLHGVPTAIKDLNALAGVPVRFGTAALDPVVPRVSDDVVTRIEAAGMISLGKTNTPEFGCPCYTEPDVAPPARTPYDLDRGSGGSSGGAAAAVAAGLLPVAHGSDGGGSIRIPASVTGLVGFKPSRGRISRAPLYADVTGLSTSGPLTTTVRDAAAYLDVMAGHRAGDALWAADPPGGAYLDWCDRNPGRLRIARFATPVVGSGAMDAQVLAAYHDAGELLGDLGHEVLDITAPLDDSVLPAFEVVWSTSAAMWPVPPDRESRLRPLTRWLRERAAGVSAAQFGTALAAMQRAAAEALELLAPYDLVLTPTLAQLPAKVGGIRDDDDPARDFARQVDFTPFTSAWNVTGMPAVSLPTSWSGEGLPIGTMLAGRPGQDHLLFAVAAQVEAACSDPGRPWRRPRVDEATWHRDGDDR